MEWFDAARALAQLSECGLRRQADFLMRGQRFEGVQVATHPPLRSQDPSISGQRFARQYTRNRFVFASSGKRSPFCAISGGSSATLP